MRKSRKFQFRDAPGRAEREAKERELVIYRDFLGMFLDEISGKDTTVLDVGCGWGRFSHILLQKGLKTVSADISEARVRFVRNSLRVVADAEELPFPANTFDAVLCVEVLSYTDKPEKALSEITRVMRTGGVLFLSVENLVGGILSSYLPPRKVKQALLLHETQSTRYFTESEIRTLLFQNGYFVKVLGYAGFTVAGPFEHLFSRVPYKVRAEFERFFRENPITCKLARAIVCICHKI